MTKLYRKNELTFAIIWIVLYVVLFSIADGLSEDLGTMKLVTAPMAVVMAAVLGGWIARNGLKEKYGLQRPEGSAGRYLYFLPLVVIASTSLWFGCQMNMTATESALRVISMLCVGFIEEIIFRGFLFKAISAVNLKRAVVISSVTFGIGHIVNLLNGAPMFETLMQIIYAVALGFLFTIIFLKSKSLIPCVVTHSAINSLSTFARVQTSAQLIVITIVLTVISIAYSAWILRQKQE